MLLRYRYRAEPTAAQRQQLARTFGCARVVFNDGLRLREDARAAGLPVRPRRRGAAPDDHRRPRARRSGPGWAEVSSVALVQACNDLHRAYRNFFDGLAGKRRGTASRARPGSAPSGARRRCGSPATASASPSGACGWRRWGTCGCAGAAPCPRRRAAAACCWTPPGGTSCPSSWTSRWRRSRRSPTEVGIDLGLVHFATLDTGEVIANPRHLRQRERRLKAAQRALSRKRKGSANRERARRRVARLHARVKDARHDFLHQTQHPAAPREPGGVRRGPGRAGAQPHPAGEERARCRRGAPSSGCSRRRQSATGARSSRCPGSLPPARRAAPVGLVDGPKPLGVRSWTCGGCGAVHDRDVNAAQNLLALGRRDRRNASGARGSPALGLAAGAEGGTSDG